MTKPFELTELSPDEWATLVDSSPQGTVFNRFDFLTSLGNPFLIFGVRYKHRIIAGAAIHLDGSGNPIIPPDGFGYCQGVLFSIDIQTLPDHTRCIFEHEILTALFDGLAQQFSGFHLGLHWNVRDLRALQWMNYHSPEKGCVTLSLRYTGLLRIDDFISPESYVRRIQERRRRDYLKARHRSLEISSSDDPAILDHLHESTFVAQNADRGFYRKTLVPITESALKNGYGELLVARNSEGKPISANLFVWHKATAHYLFGANDPDERGSGAATLLMIESIFRAKGRGLSIVDFVGINSPQRGNFKTSFNAAPVPYFDAHWSRPN